jgi:carbon storage regulator
MLVLTRKIGEQIVIGDNVRVTVVSVGPGRVKIGIEAPASVSIDRQEVHAKKHGEADPVPAPTAIVEVEDAVLHNRIATLAPTTVTTTPPLRQRLVRKPR